MKKGGAQMALEQEKSYTYGDLIDMDDETRYELYNGELVALAAPLLPHQIITTEIVRQLATYLLGKKCRVLQSPVDVRLFEKEGDERRNAKTVLQPDALIVCDPKKLDIHGVKGAPDLVIEVLSPSTMKYDLRLKYNLYQKAGVKEYWIVDPEKQIVSVYTLEDGRYNAAAVYNSQSEILVGVLDDCKIDLRTVFADL